MNRITPYVLISVGLIPGLVILLSEPLPSRMLNYVIGGAFLAVAIASVTYLIIASSGPDERRPDF